MFEKLNLPALYAFSSTSYKKQLAYRIANWSGLFTNIFFLFIRAGVFLACFQNKDSVAGLTLIDTLTYLTLTQSFFILMPHVGNMGVSEHIRSGQIAIELNRPLNFYSIYMSKRIGIFLYYFIFRFFPIILFASFFDLLRMPSSLTILPLFFLSIFMGFWITVSIMFLVEATAFWLESDRGLKICTYGILGFFSGLLIPLNFFPNWALKITKLLPFSSTFNTPTQIYLGIESSEQLGFSILIQLFWAISLSLACLKVLSVGEKKVVLHGG